MLRPEPGATATTSAARTMGIDVVKLPLFEAEALDWAAPVPEEYDGLLVTSANAMRLGGGGLARFKALPVFAVGPATAESARNRGFEVQTEGHSGIESLLDQLPRPMRLLHLAGRDRIDVPTGTHVIDVAEVYRVEARPLEGAERVQGAVVALHSARAAERFRTAADEAGLDRSTISLIALSAAVADQTGAGWEHLAIADQPTDAALLALARTLCL